MTSDFASPSLQLETSSGIYTQDIATNMFAHRELAVVGDIDQAGAFRTCQLIRHLDRLDPSQPITLFIDSNGGDFVAGLAIYDIMRETGCRVKTVCLGVAASIAATLFVSGDERAIYPHAELMVHDPLTLGGGGSALSVREQSRRLMEARETAAGILSRHSGLAIEEVYKMTATDTYLSAQEAVDNGFADYVVDCG